MNTPSILKKIVAQKKIRIAEEKAIVSYDEMKTLAANTLTRNSFSAALQKDSLSIIGEIKKASPSKGIIRAQFNPVKIAKEYNTCVDALSVLTEADFFQGSYDYLEAVSKTVDLPILCKDFIVDEYQIYKAKTIGASAMLLIVAILDIETIKKFLNIAHTLNLDALVETHSIEEAEIAIEAGAKIMGVNNRNLHTFNVDINTTIEVSKIIGNNTILVSESGISTAQDIVKLKDVNLDAILVGESFMRCNNIEEKAREFKDAYQS